MDEITIADRKIGEGHPAYFIADIGANHDGQLERARNLIHLAAEAGADAAKFQNFQAPKIVSDYGFKHLEGKQSHQDAWKKSVFEVYQDASIPFDWTPILKEECDKAGIHYFSSPYDYESTDMLESYVPAYKAGSGLMSWPELLIYMARKEVPILVSTGACELGEVVDNMRAILEVNDQVVLFQCNTNYTGSDENFDHIHLKVLKTYRQLFPDVVLGLSDHTAGHATVLGAVAIGARVIEKHFTDDTTREGPDHPFAMDPHTWSDMVARTRELERAMGSPLKQVAENEKETVYVQRRCLRAARDIRTGEVLTREMIDVLRPAAPGAIQARDLERVLGTKIVVDIPMGEALMWTMLVSE
ncbi:MAG: N-acetylneuraminate synthase family protein [Anaerolineales bacterium]|nr:N-acetylneuraminate synthase family protein [Anaerolineales bacterium]